MFENYVISLLGLTYLSCHLLIALAIKMGWNKKLRYRIIIFFLLIVIVMSYFQIVYSPSVLALYILRIVFLVTFWLHLIPIESKEIDDSRKNGI